MKKPRRKKIVGKQSDKRIQKLFARSFGFARAFLGEELAQRIAADAKKLGPFFHIANLLNGEIDISFASAKKNFGVSIEHEKIIVEKLEFDEHDISMKDVMRAKHEIDQEERERFKKEMLRRRKKMPLPVTTKKICPFNPNENGNLLKALRFAVGEALSEIERELHGS